MVRSYFPGCCGAKILTGFPYDHNLTNPRKELTQLKAVLEREIKLCMKRDNCSIITATTNDEQLQAAKILKELGFRCSPWASRPSRPPKTKIRLWYYLTNQTKK